MTTFNQRILSGPRIRLGALCCSALAQIGAVGLALADQTGTSYIKVASTAEQSALQRQVQARDTEVSGERGTADVNEPQSLQEIVVTAEKRTERLQNVPIAISVLSGSRLDESTVQGVAEALNAVPGVTTTETYLGGGTNIAIRGVTTGFPLYAGQSTVAYYLDGMPFGLVKSAIAPDADVYDLERIEVLRGPQGTLYGASALNGVVRILTEDPDPTAFDFKARGSGADTENSDGSYRGDAMMNVPIVEDKLAARADIGYLHNGGWIDQPDKTDANYTDIGNYRLKLDGRPTERLSIDLEAWASRLNSGAPDLGYTWDKSHTLLNEPTSTDYDLYGMKLEYRADKFVLSSETSYLTFSNNGTLGLDVPGFGVPGSIFYARSSSDVTSEELDLHSSQPGDWQWSAGGMYRKGTEGRLQSFTVLQIPTINYIDNSKSYAVYGELTRLFLADRLGLTVGVRHFHDDISQRDQLAPDTPYLRAASTAEANTPRVLLAWHANPRLMVYGSYSEGFRSGFPQDATVLEAYPAFAPVKPDTLKNYEMGTKGTLADGRVAFDASIYHMDWQNIQLELAVPVHGVPYTSVVNGAHASGDGTDLSLTLKPTENIIISPDISWNDLALDNEVFSAGQILYRNGDRPSGSLRASAGLSVDYVFSIGSRGLAGKLSVSGNYSSPQSYRFLSGSGVIVQTGNSIVTSRASFAIDSDHWTYTLYGDNLNNDHGIVAMVFSGVVPDWESRVRPLTVGLQVEYHFR